MLELNICPGELGAKKAFLQVMQIPHIIAATQSGIAWLVS